MKTLIMTVIISLCILSCKDSIISPPIDNIAGFPLSVGSRWTYAIYDSVNHQSDTVDVVIVMKLLTALPKDVYIWRYQYRTHTDSLYAIRSGDTVDFASSLERYYHTINFVFPLYIGSKWGTAFTDSVSVLSKDSIVVPSGAYAECFRIEARSLIPNDYSRFLYWVKPNVGIVKVLRNIFVSVDLEGMRKETWQLLSYSLAE